METIWARNGVIIHHPDPVMALLIRPFKALFKATGPTDIFAAVVHLNLDALGPEIFIEEQFGTVARRVIPDYQLIDWPRLLKNCPQACSSNARRL